MTKIKLVMLLMTSLFFLSTPVSAEELSCPDGGGAMQVQYGDVVNCEIESAGDLDTYTIDATEGDFISANVTYNGTDEDECVYLQFLLRGLDIKNKQLAISRSVRCSGTRIEFTVAKTNIHTITVSDYADQNFGKYQIEFQCISGSCIKQALLPKQECVATFDGSELKAPFIQAGDKSYWVDFKLISGDPIQLELTNFGER